jgi:hypothetical protein
MQVRAAATALAANRFFAAPGPRPGRRCRAGAAWRGNTGRRRSDGFGRRLGSMAACIAQPSLATGATVVRGVHAGGAGGRADGWDVREGEDYGATPCNVARWRWAGGCRVAGPTGGSGAMARTAMPPHAPWCGGGGLGWRRGCGVAGAMDGFGAMARTAVPPHATWCGGDGRFGTGGAGWPDRRAGLARWRELRCHPMHRGAVVVGRGLASVERGGRSDGQAWCGGPPLPTVLRTSRPKPSKGRIAQRPLAPRGSGLPSRCRHGCPEAGVVRGGGPKHAALASRHERRLVSAGRMRATIPCTPRIRLAEPLPTRLPRGRRGARRRAETCGPGLAPRAGACVRGANARNDPMHPEDRPAEPLPTRLCLRASPGRLAPWVGSLSGAGSAEHGGDGGAQKCAGRPRPMERETRHGALGRCGSPLSHASASGGGQKAQQGHAARGGGGEGRAATPWNVTRWW